MAEAPPAFEAPVAHEAHAAYETPAVFEALANFEAARRSPEPAPPVGSDTPPADPFFASAFGPPTLASRFGQQPDEEVAAGQGVDEVVAEAPPSRATDSNFEVGGEFGYRAEEDYDAAVGAQASDDKQSGYLPAWAGEISDPAWDYGETEPEENTAQATSASDTAAAAAATIAPFDWAASAAPPKPVGSNGSSSAAPTAPAAPAPAPDAWDPMVTQKSASNPFDAEPSPAAPAGGAPAKPSWLSSIDHGVSIASTIPPPDPGAWVPPAPTAPLSGKGSSESNPSSFTPTSPAEISPASFAPKTPDLGVASPLVTGPTVDTRLQPAAPAAPGQTLPATPASAPTSAAPIVPVGNGAPAPTTAAASWDTVPPREAAPTASGHAVGPAEQARNTADGLRRLTRRVPGASLPQEDGSLRRPTPTSTTRNPLGLTGALSQYLSATANEGRPEKEHNAR